MSAPQFGSKPPYENAPISTDVLGYFNPYDYPFHLDLTETGTRHTIKSREFLCLWADGKQNGQSARIPIRVNDPILEKYCGPKGLAKHISPELVPIVWLPRLTASGRDISTADHGGTASFKTDDQYRVLNPTDILKPKPQHPASSSAVAGYSMEDAIKLGVIEQVKPLLPDQGGETESSKSTEKVPALPPIDRPVTTPIMPGGASAQTPLAENRPAAVKFAPAVPAAKPSGPTTPAPVIAPQSVSARTTPPPSAAVVQAAPITQPSTALPEDDDSDIPGDLDPEGAFKVPDLNLGALTAQKVTPEAAATIVPAEPATPAVVASSPPQLDGETEVAASPETAPASPETPAVGEKVSRRRRGAAV